jgi:N-acetyl-1-D-myo-inositol-2-amino-2-deoxy-alpha-D-glucopyranoside deacetylase
VPGSGGLLLVHAHPDDETITCGGVMALAAGAGVPVTLVTCTRGDLGEVIPPELAHLSGEALAVHRDRELDAACAVLGVTDRRYLGGAGTWHDSGMVATEGVVHAVAPASLAPGAFAREEDRDEQVAQLVAVLRETEPRVVVSYDRDGGYGHPDHVRAHEITVAAVAEVDPEGTEITLQAAVAPRGEVAAGLDALRRRGWLPVPVPGVEAVPTVDDALVTTRVVLGPARVAKLAALRAHATQITVLDDGREPPAYTLSNALAQPVLGAESFVLLRGPKSPADSLFPAEELPR